MNKIMLMTIFNRKGKTSAFLIVLVGLSCSTFKDDNVKEKNYDNDYQSEVKNQCFFDGVVLALNLDDFIAKWPCSIGRETPVVF